MSNKHFLGLAILTLFVFSIVGNVLQYCNPPEPIVRETIVTLTKVDTLVKERPIYLTKLSSKLDTIYIDNTPQVTATADTLLKEDSSKIKITYFFPPRNRFDVDMDLKEKLIIRTDSVFKTIEKTLPYEESFWDRFNISVQAGFGQGMIHKNFDVYYGIGLSYKIKGLF
jgi:hypothetical protein